MKRMTALVTGVGLAAVSPLAYGQLNFKPSHDQQVKLGKDAAAEIRQKEKVLPASDVRVQTLRRIGRQLLSKLDDGGKPWEYSFDVVDSNEVNAFALPGGPTFFYTGLLNRMKTEDELAAVLGHELTHVRKEHWAYQYRDQRQQSTWFTLGALIVRPGRDVSNVLGTALGLVNLKFSRKHESESDTQGYNLMVDAGFNPQGMVDVFEMLRAAGGGKPPEWLSSHPDDRNRIRTIQNRINADKRRFPPMRPLPWAK